LVEEALHDHGFRFEIVQECVKFDVKFAKSLFHGGLGICLDGPSTRRAEGFDSLKGPFDQSEPTTGQSRVNAEYEHTFDATVRDSPEPVLADDDVCGVRETAKTTGIVTPENNTHPS
jgi:hypothetical protein